MCMFYFIFFIFLHSIDSDLMCMLCVCGTHLLILEIFSEKKNHKQLKNYFQIFNINLNVIGKITDFFFVYNRLIKKNYKVGWFATPPVTQERMGD